MIKLQNTREKYNGKSTMYNYMKIFLRCLSNIILMDFSSIHISMGQKLEGSPLLRRGSLHYLLKLDGSISISSIQLSYFILPIDEKVKTSEMCLSHSTLRIKSNGVIKDIYYELGSFR